MPQNRYFIIIQTKNIQLQSIWLYQRNGHTHTHTSLLKDKEIDYAWDRIQSKIDYFLTPKSNF